MSDTLWSMLERSAARAPSAVAFVEPCAGGERVLTFAELQESVLRAAAAFRSAGVRAGDRVAVMARNGSCFVSAYLGLSRLKAVAVPVNFMISKTEELSYILSHCKAVGAVCDREFRAALERTGLERVWDESFLSSAAALPADLPPPEPRDLACVLYTSGTTGKPKGVMLTHANLVANCDACIEAFDLAGKRAVFLCLLPMFHTFAWTVCVLIPLRLGVKSLLVPSIAPPEPWLKAMGRHGVSVFAAVPQVYSVVARSARGFKRLFLRWWSFRRVRLCISGAAPLAAATREEFKRALGLTILQGYGLTETSPVATINRPDSDVPGTVGPPLPGVEVRIVSEEGGALPSGAEGEVLLKGPNVMAGYLDDPEATREALSEEGWLKTGDIGALGEGGHLEIRDRKKDMIIVKGLKVFSAQIEDALLSHPDVLEAAVIGLPDETGDETIKAFVVLKEGAASGKADILRFCREKFDAYKRPRDVEIVKALPKNALQKVLKRVLRQQELDRRAGGPS